MAQPKKQEKDRPEHPHKGDCHTESEGDGLLSDISSPVAKKTLEQMTAFINKHLG